MFNRKLIKALIRGDEARVLELLPSSDRATPKEYLERMIERKSIVGCELLFKHCTLDVNYALYYAICRNKLPLIQYFIDAGATSLDDLYESVYDIIDDATRALLVKLGATAKPREDPTWVTYGEYLDMRARFEPAPELKPENVTVENLPYMDRGWLVQHARQLPPFIRDWHFKPIYYKAIKRLYTHTLDSEAFVKLPNVLLNEIRKFLI
jgi:hypothetical protein